MKCFSAQSFPGKLHDSKPSLPQETPMRKQQTAIIAFAAWVTVVSAILILARWVDLEVFFILCLIGFLVIVQIIQPGYIQPGYLRYIKYLIAAGIILFGIIVIKRVLDIIAR